MLCKFPWNIWIDKHLSSQTLLIIFVFGRSQIPVTMTKIVARETSRPFISRVVEYPSREWHINLLNRSNDWLHFMLFHTRVFTKHSPYIKSKTSNLHIFKSFIISTSHFALLLTWASIWICPSYVVHSLRSSNLQDFHSFLIVLLLRSKIRYKHRSTKIFSQSYGSLI